MWCKLDDQIMRNRKIRDLLARPKGHEAFSLHIAGLAYCASGLTDGFIPTRDLPLVAAEALARETCARDLAEVAMWAEVDDGWEIHDFLDYHPSRDEVLEDRRKARDRKRSSRRGSSARHGDSHGERHGATSNGTTGVTASVTDSVTDDGSHAPPVPSRPVPSEDPVSSSVLPAETPSTGPVDDDETIHGIRLGDVYDAALPLRYAAHASTVHSRRTWERTTRANLPGEIGAQARDLLERYEIDSAYTVAQIVEGQRDARYLTERSAS